MSDDSSIFLRVLAGLPEFYFELVEAPTNFCIWPEFDALPLPDILVSSKSSEVYDSATFSFFLPAALNGLLTPLSSTSDVCFVAVTGVDFFSSLFFSSYFFFHSFIALISSFWRYSSFSSSSLIRSFSSLASLRSFSSIIVLDFAASTLESFAWLESLSPST